MGAGGKRSIPDGAEDTCVRADTPAAGSVVEGRGGGRRCADRVVQVGRTEDRRGSPGGGSERRPGPRLLREWGGARPRISEWLPTGPPPDGGRRIEYGVPQVADRAEPFESQIRAGLAGRTAELERLAVTASWLPTMAHRPSSWIGLIHEPSVPASYATATANRVSVSSVSRPPRSKRAIWSRTSCSTVSRTSVAKPT